ncbi:methyltransferase domain-containing protein [Aureispira sp. CCB-QB1]|uniref:class I SAM-dependent methyltransferase n=1 Tax=Aureispira sp. CCB-QB1 TaxID=1313421 RepID=UPI0006979657|nr:methyltransferase domain-containing protein [Aureispira sp. CCB-QB1]
MKLEIGCGKKPRAGYLTCDIRDLPNVDYVCSADQLPFESGTVDEVYSRHVVEHFTLKEFLKVLAEWNRVLKTGGVVYIICPNLLWHLQQIISGSHASFYSKTSGSNDRFWGMGSLFGWQQDEYDVHKFGYYFELMKDILIDFGFTQVEDLTNTGRGLENEPWHLEIQAVKQKASPQYEESRFFKHFDVTH